MSATANTPAACAATVLTRSKVKANSLAISGVVPLSAGHLALRAAVRSKVRLLHLESFVELQRCTVTGCIRPETFDRINEKDAGGQYECVALCCDLRNNADIQAQLLRRRGRSRQPSGI